MNESAGEEQAPERTRSAEPAWRAWLLASRPKTLAAAFSPVVIGTSLAYGAGVGDAVSAGLCLLAALAIQIGANFSNDYYDGLRGTDNAERLGPRRATASGLIAPAHVRLGFQFCYGAFLALVLALAWRAGWAVGWWLLPLGVAAAVAAHYYTGGPKPYGYRGWGDAMAFVFFGPVATYGTTFAQTRSHDWAPLLAGLMPGALACALLTVNNLRDRHSDARSGKRSLAVRFGATFARVEYTVCLLTAALVPAALLPLTPGHAGMLAAGAILPLGAPALWLVWRREGPVLNRALALTGALMLLHALLFCAGHLWR